MKFTLDVKSMIYDIQAIDKRSAKAIKPIMHKAKAELKVATLRQVPVLTGTLQDSLFATISGPKLTIGYTADYAMYVHENVGAFFLNGKAKFLEDPLREYTPRFIADIVRTLNEVIR